MVLNLVYNTSFLKNIYVSTMCICYQMNLFKPASLFLLLLQVPADAPRVALQMLNRILDDADN